MPSTMREREPFTNPKELPLKLKLPSPEKKERREWTSKDYALAWLITVGCLLVGPMIYALLVSMNVTAPLNTFTHIVTFTGAVSWGLVGVIIVAGSMGAAAHLTEKDD